MLAAIRLRGHVKVDKEVEDTMKMLGLRHVNTLALLPDTQVVRGMLKKVESFITWGSASQELLDKLRKKGNETTFRLKPPEQGFISIKKAFPQGDLGFRGDNINELIKRMASV
jgi:large subunit ribosomal protein L30